MTSRQSQAVIGTLTENDKTRPLKMPVTICFEKLQLCLVRCLNFW